MQVAIEMQCLNGFGAVCLEPTIHVVKFHAGEKCRDAVEKEREYSLFERVLARVFPP